MTWHLLDLIDHRLICDFVWLDCYDAHISMYWVMDSLPIFILKGTILPAGLPDEENQSSG